MLPFTQAKREKQRYFHFEMKFKCRAYINTHEQLNLFHFEGGKIKL